MKAMGGETNKKGLLLFFCLLFLSALFPPLSHATDKNILIIVSSEIRPYKEALQGLKNGLSLPHEVYILRSNPKLVEHVLKNEVYDAVVAIGPRAAKAVESYSQVPPQKRLFLMVLDPEETLGRKGPCAVSMRIPYEVMVKEIASRFGEGVRVGILFNLEENFTVVQGIKKASGKKGPHILGIPVTTPAEVIKAFRAHSESLDCLLFIPDSVVIKEALVEYLLKECVLRGIAAIGYNRFFHENGAVMSFVIDYEKVGERGARLLKDMVDRAVCGDIPPPYSIEWNQKAWDTVMQKR